MASLCVLGNDDERPVHVAIDELHPRSRLRLALADAATRNITLRLGCSRDALRSLVASERHGALLPQGRTSLEELRAELARDCADDLLPPPSAPSHPLQSWIGALCDELAAGLVAHPELQRQTDCSSASPCTRGASFLWVRLGCKPRDGPARLTALHSMERHALAALAAESARRGGTPLHELPLEWGRWMPPQAEGAAAALREARNSATGYDEWAARVTQAVHAWLEQLPCPGSLFAPPPEGEPPTLEQVALSEALLARGWKVCWATPPAGVRPLAFPAWWPAACGVVVYLRRVGETF